jgi:hypothetical protein
MKKNQVFNLFVIMLLVVAWLPAQQAVRAQAMAGDQIAPDAQFVPGELVVSFARGSSPAVYTQRANGLATGLGGKVSRQYENSALLSFTPNASVTALIKRIFALFPDVTVQPNYIYRLPETDAQIQGGALVKSTSGLSKLSSSELLSLRSGSTIAGSPAFPNEVDTALGQYAWGWQQVGGEIIWSQALSTANVCLIDTGVDTAHPEFAGMTLAGYDYVNGDTTPNDDNGHGTHLAGIIIAKANNGAGTAIGIANTKLVPVKAANAQGWGTSFNVAAALTFCAAQATVKVINLSLVSSNPDQLVYSSLKNAILTKGKLVVVAAGNDSKSYNVSGGHSTPASFPGGWAIANVGLDGIYYDPAPGGNNANAISSGLISVAAGRDPSLKTWVDSTVDPGIIDASDELHDNCATEFSNYGNWVNLVAPGGNIYSTTPKSYPFYMNFQFGVPATYGVMSGTSQAAAFVSGAASRVWGVYSTITPAQVKTRLVASGTALDQVTDLGNSIPLNPNIGFANDSGVLGQPYGTVLDDPAYAPNPVVMAPFCWPDATAPFTALQDMGKAKYLNVASAMNRVAFWVIALDASSGMPLAGATVRALLGTTGTTAAGLPATVPSGLTRTLPNVALINVPLNYDKSTFGPLPTTFRLQVSKTSYTNSYQTFNKVDVTTDQAGTFITDPYSRVSLLPSTIIQAVVDWTPPDPNDLDTNAVYSDPKIKFPNLDAVVFLPNNVGPTSTGAIVGPMNTPAGLTSIGISNYMGGGTLTDPSKICGTATCMFLPFALYQHDGGLDQGLDANGLRLFSATEEGISITGATAAAPLYLKPKFAGTYTIMVTANNAALLDADTSIFPVVRIWAKGNLLRTVTLADATTSCDGVTNSWWKVATYSATATAAPNTCGSSSDTGFFPY